MKRSFGPTNSEPTSPSQGGDVSAPRQVSNTSESELAKREGILEERERLLAEKHNILDTRIEDTEKLRKDLVTKLEKVSQMSVDEAQKILLEQVDKDLAVEISQKIKTSEDEIKLQSDEKAKEILGNAMLHGVTDYISEFTTSRVKLEDEDMKGRIIGREGRNIRTFEQATGVDVVMDDEVPDTLILSSFDPIRREIAKVSLERLIADGRIQPQRIEEIVAKTEEDIEKIMCQAGEKLAQDAGVFSLPAEVICLMGRFKYRYSFGQSLIQHSLEVSQVAVEIARLIGADINVVRVGGLLHDIGKILTDGYDEGTHVEKGVLLAKKFGFPEKVINCIAEHHEDKPFSSIESICVYLGDSVSGGRPGARHEDVTQYAKRLDDIEKIALSFDGVDRVFAVEAGREVRVIVMPDKISDDLLPKLTHDIAERISKEVMVPGAVKVTAIREVRVTESTMTTPQ